ncbi:MULTISPECIES: hypothetical protein [Microbacterium]|uniref:Uncharacterized protein n=1 Tax=Microbacterium maritypicum TaxID=33918 RepID=A0A4Y4B4M7_MICMQ|nr:MULTISPECIES: hypothetical protein [Microbacterium]QYG12221.1 hypothetical protein KY497_02635 [Microbacterium sp. PAMC22086]GEC73864.1 hypothetical protein MLI01_00090 [Microbacterium liquefaciens]GGV47902.1 hypothetical protein GCM10010213_00090 [Microbacterium liquefaciens]
MTVLAGLPFGSWFEGLGAVGAVAAALVSVFALRSALAANATADQTRRDAKSFADETRAREQSREHAGIARQLQAWWVVWAEGEDKRFGVFVTNAGEGATVFRDVRIETRGNSNVRSASGAIAFTSLPPGSYVLMSNAAGSEQPWGDPQVTRPDVAYEPLLKAQRYAVTCITFEDPMKQAWCWTPERGLERQAGARSVSDDRVEGSG